MTLHVGQKPSDKYNMALKQCIREAFMKQHNQSHGQLRKMHRVGIASKTLGIITRKMKRGEWAYGYPDESTMWRRLNEMANDGDFLVFVEPKGSGWYMLADGVVEVKP